MAQQLLYKNLAPVSPQRHGDLCVDRMDYAYAAGVNAVPVLTAEMTAAAPEYSIVFAGEGSVMPVAILGLRQHTNQFVAEDGSWSARFIPGFVRRYPFVLSEQGDEYVLCVDENWSGCNREGRGERLFDDQGQRTDFLSSTLRMLLQAQARFEHTRNFCSRLQEFELLEPMKADVTLPSGEVRSLGGFMAVSREKLKSLDPEQLAELAQSDELELTYLHLNSMKNLLRLPEITSAQAV